MKKDNIKSPKQKSPYHWTKGKMRKAKPYPMPEVPPESGPRSAPPGASRREHGQSTEGGQPESD